MAEAHLHLTLEDEDAEALGGGRLEHHRLSPRNRLEASRELRSDEGRQRLLRQYLEDPRFCLPSTTTG